MVSLFWIRLFYLFFKGELGACSEPSPMISRGFFRRHEIVSLFNQIFAQLYLFDWDFLRPYIRFLICLSALFILCMLMYDILRCLICVLRDSDHRVIPKAYWNMCHANTLAIWIWLPRENPFLLLHLRLILWNCILIMKW